MPRDCMTDIESYFSYIFNPKSFEYGHIKNMLNGWCALTGSSTAGYADCYFSPEWQEHGLAYFGEGKVLFDFHAPAVDEDKQIIISYQEFYEIVRRHCSAYANQHPEEKEEILRLLARLKKRLGACGGRGAAMMLKLAKWCSIIPLLVHAPWAAVVFAELFADPTTVHQFSLTLLLSLLLSVFATPVLAALGIVLSAVLIFRKERKAMKFLVLSCADIIISALLYWGIL